MLPPWVFKLGALQFHSLFKLRHSFMETLYIPFESIWFINNFYSMLQNLTRTVHGSWGSVKLRGKCVLKRWCPSKSALGAVWLQDEAGNITWEIGFFVGLEVGTDIQSSGCCSGGGGAAQAFRKLIATSFIRQLTYCPMLRTYWLRFGRSSLYPPKPFPTIF